MQDFIPTDVMLVILKNKLEDIHKNFKDVLDKDELLKDGAQTFKDVYRRTFAIFTNENWAPRLGDETFDKNDPNWGIGSYWYDPLQFMKDIKTILTKSK